MPASAIAMLAMGRASAAVLEHLHPGGLPVPWALALVEELPRSADVGVRR